MDGFKKTPKMQCFKEGGSVQREVKNFTKRDRKTVDEADTAQDKKIVKKAIGMHDVQQHEEKTDLSGLKKGGRAKKAQGTVKKFKTGGSVTNVYEAKKSSGDKDNIKKVKDITPGKAAAPSKAAVKPAFKGSDVAKEKSKPSSDATSLVKSKASGKSASAPSGAKGGPNKYKTGGKVKKYADGGGIMDAIGGLGTQLKNNIMGTPEQNRIAQARMDMIARKKAAEQAALLGGQGGAGALQQGALAGGMAPAASPNTMPATDQMGNATGIAAQKRGGKVKKMQTGGTCS